MFERVGDGERAHAREDLSRVGLAAGGAPEAPVEILAAHHEAHRRGDVQGVETAEDLARRERAVRESGVDLAPFVSSEGPVRTLQRRDVRRHRVAVDEIQLVVEREHLHRAQGVQHVRVVALVRAETAARVATPHHPIHDRVAVHRAELTHQVHPGQTPVHAAHAKVLRQDVLHGVPIFG